MSRAALAAASTLPPGHHTRTTALSNLGNCLLSRAQLNSQLGNELSAGTDGRDEALALARQAWQETPAADPKVPLRLASLAGMQFAVGAQQDPGERDATIAALRDVAAALPDGHIMRAPILFNLGVLLYFSDRGGTADADRLAAIEAWQQAAQDRTAASGERLQAAYRWGAGAFHAALPGLAVAGYACAAGLFPQAAWRGVDLSGQQRIAAEWQGLAGEAAAAALTADEPGLAVEMLEGTRAVAWAQLLELRSDLTKLAGKHGDLARRLTQIRLDLDTGSAGIIAESLSSVPLRSSAGP